MFSFFSWIGGSVDSVMDTVVETVSSNAITGFQVVLITAVALYITCMGYAIISGAVDAPLPTFLKQCMKIIIIAAFCITPEYYMGTIVSGIQGLETGLASIFSSSTAATDQATNIYEVLDRSADTSFNMGYQIFEKMANRDWYDIGGLVWDLILGSLIILASIVIHLPAAATIIIAKVGLAILLGIGPVFVAALMFPITAQWFDRWFQKVMGFIFEISIVMVIVTLGVALFKKAVDSIINRAGGAVPEAVYSLADGVQIILVAFLVLAILKRCAGLGAEIAGGISFGAVTYRGVGNAINSPSTRRDMESGMMVTAGRLNHLVAGNTVANPAYQQHVSQNIGKHWGWKRGGAVARR